ncbi:unnamed protein product [Rotaria magnacalcarata]|uniref:ER membrane protein complex subunit 7 beta-sandwich domain-containing protein n=1 Tax=Rotaria magnacalcarata TaxID=392030 RepID=A0A819I7H9_9BILA|nr:unnamed protein product [Rotaria magnacalcarata]CAF1650200.1 unnamed protein product [Rotaria magnacalcarata]CAF2025552.1 unnamed protein product [Rotaria magnacalcarata]CAF2054018.1 unnamed protein product [Rotaria magnacalcarata]CAF2266962.1 unnamed protein product [Rotaria magnacalcarata]
MSSSNKLGSYKIEGQIVFPPGGNALADTRILVNQGEYIGIPRIDGTFVISGVPSGSYEVSVSSPQYAFEPVRVDINTKGKIRAREVNRLRPQEVVTVKYPLHFDTYTEPNYFQKREVNSWDDIIFNPIIIPIVLGIVLMLVGPKLVSQEQLDEMQHMFPQGIGMFQPNLNMPDLVDICIRLFGAPRRQRRLSQQSLTVDTKAPVNTRRRKQKKKIPKKQK